MTPPSSLLSRVAASAAAVLLARVVALLATFGFTAILARQLSPSDFGQFAFLFSLTGLLSLIANVGLNRAIVKRLSETEQLSKSSARSIVGFGFCVTMILGAVVGAIVGFALYQLGFIQAGQPGRVALVYGGIICLRATHLSLAESARGFHEKIWSNLFGSPAGGPIPHVIFVAMLVVFRDSFAGTLSEVLTLYLVSFAMTMPLLGWVMVRMLRRLPTGAIANDVPSDASESRRAHRLALTGSRMDLLGIGLPLMVTQACGLAMSQADVWVGGVIVAPATFALYAAAQRLLALLTLPLQICGTAIVSMIPDWRRRIEESSKL